MSSDTPRSPRFWLFLVGLMCVTASTLGIELLDTRLLSVVTWYHLTFLALSIAMSGMAAGALYVFAGGERFSGERAPAELARFASYFAVSMVVSHLVALCIPVNATTGNPNSVLSLLVLTGVLTVPFVVSGVVVTISLTRIPGRTGLIYAADLVGASLGSVLVLPVLQWFDLTTAAYAACFLAAVGAGCFAVYARRESHVLYWFLAGFLVLSGWAQASGTWRLRVANAKDYTVANEEITDEYWTIHGQVMAFAPEIDRPFYWGPGQMADEEPDVERVSMVIDGLAGTYMTSWDGTASDLAWVRHDVTTLPYRVWGGGDAAVIGVGGGRDVLSALWGGADHVTGIEINRAFIDLLDRKADFSGIPDDPRVTLVHDEARSWLTRTDERFDVLQMSLIDTWAATGAGAFTLTENGLYTVEAFTTFMERLTPTGLFSVSRWYSPGMLSETTRLVSLTTAALVELGVADPRAHMLMVTRSNVSTMLVGRAPFTPDQLREIERVSEAEGFAVVLSPERAGSELIDRIASSTSDEQIAAAVADNPLDLSPPTDDRPYFFSLLLPGSPVPDGMLAHGGGVVAGNIIATRVLAIAVVGSLLVLVALVVVPLLGFGLPDLPVPLFAGSLLYFSLIGAGYMLTQVGLLQRLGPYLGHPVYAVSVVLFSMILASGIGSALSDRLDPVRTPAVRVAAGLLTAAGLLLVRFGLPAVADATVASALVVRIAVAVAAVAPVSLLMGLHFPLGMRSVLSLSEPAAPWMWGINGAAGVLASGAAVVLSMWFGIGTTLLLAAAFYALLAWPSSVLWAAVAD